MDGRAEVASNEASSTAVTPQEQREQLEKVLRSQAFRAAHGLQKFLEYVASKAIAGLSDEIKEYTIGTQVFGRTTDYDPRIDTVVRVQALRLREKLREYYDSEGATDGVLLVIPKGHYVPCFTRRFAQRATPLATELGSSPSSGSPPQGLGAGAGKDAPRAQVVPTSMPGPLRQSRNRLLWVQVGLAAVGLVGLVFLLTRLQGVRSPRAADAGQQGRTRAVEVGAPLVGLWADFLKNESSPMVAYSNDVFLKTESSDLLRVRSEEIDNLGATASSGVANRLSMNPRLLLRAGPVSFDDSYTGTGEVMAVFYLTRMFGQFHASLGVKRSRLVTADDLSQHDLIFLGSTRENALLAGLPLTQDFVFAWPQPVGAWKGRIINVHPQQGEATWYEVERDPKSHVLRTDYALVSFLPGIAPTRKIVVLAGMTTLGTQGAADFATSPTAMAELVDRLGTGPSVPGRKIPSFFQALLRVEIIRGDVLSVHCVAGHVIRPSQHLAQKN